MKWLRNLLPRDGAGHWNYLCGQTAGHTHECSLPRHDDYRHVCACGLRFAHQQAA